MTTAADKVTGEKRKALGRGLDSLLPGGPRVVAGGAAGAASLPEGGAGAALPSVMAAVAAKPAGSEVVELPLQVIDKNPYQTRTWLTDDDLAELADSIRANGVIQPITVRPLQNGRYLLITGERRWRASKLAEKEKVPAIVRRVSAQQAAEMTIIENLQREDLNCVDQARAFARMSLEFSLTQEQIGQRVGVSRETVSNYMRLLKLPAEVQHYLEKGQLDFSAARILLTLPTPELAQAVADRAVQRHLSVEQLREWIEKASLPQPAAGEAAKARWVDPNVRAAQRELERLLGVRVRIRDRKGKGKIVIEYSTLEDFDRVLAMLKGRKQ